MTFPTASPSDGTDVELWAPSFPGSTDKLLFWIFEYRCSRVIESEPGSHLPHFPYFPMPLAGSWRFCGLPVCRGIFAGRVIQLSVRRGSIPAKVGFWVGLRMFLYVCIPTKLTNAIPKTQLLGPKKGGVSPKIPPMWPFFVFGVF